jgi:hypothetical protein
MELVAALVTGHLVTYIHGGQNQHGNWWSMDSAGQPLTTINLSCIASFNLYVFPIMMQSNQ